MGDEKKCSVSKVGAYDVQLELPHLHCALLMKDLGHALIKRIEPLKVIIFQRSRIIAHHWYMVQLNMSLSTKLYVGNVPDSAKEKDLKELFQSFGDVDEVAVLRGYGFVVSQTPPHAFNNYRA